MENERLRFLLYNQPRLKGAPRDQLLQAIAANEQRDEGTPIVLPSSFTGGPRWYHQQFLDTMARVRVLGKPSLFITFTANPD